LRFSWTFFRCQSFAVQPLKNAATPNINSSRQRRLNCQGFHRFGFSSLHGMSAL
jgi:hypothetical protein